MFARLKFWSFERWTFLHKCFLFNHCIINGHGLTSLPTSSQSKSLGYKFVCLSVIAATYLSCIRWWIFSLIFIHKEIVIFGKANRSEASLFAILFSTWMIDYTLLNRCHICRFFLPMKCLIFFFVYSREIVWNSVKKKGARNQNFWIKEILWSREVEDIDIWDSAWKRDWNQWKDSTKILSRIPFILFYLVPYYGTSISEGSF